MRTCKVALTYRLDSKIFKPLRDHDTLLKANSEIQNLTTSVFFRLRFLDVSGNQITNITPLEALPDLSGINLANNQIVEIGPLFNLPSLTNVLLEGNSAIPCTQLRSLEQKLERTFNLPPRCSP